MFSYIFCRRNSLSMSSSLSDLVGSPTDRLTDHVLTIEELRAHLGSCFTCGVSWTDEHVSLDCHECGGYSSKRPCPLCNGICGVIWKRDFTMVSYFHVIGYLYLLTILFYFSLMPVERLAGRAHAHHFPSSPTFIYPQHLPPLSSWHRHNPRRVAPANCWLKNCAPVSNNCQPVLEPNLTQQPHSIESQNH